MQHRRPAVAARGLSPRGPGAQSLCGMWSLPTPGIEPVSPAPAGRFSSSAPPGKSCSFLLVSSGLSARFTFSSTSLMTCLCLKYPRNLYSYDSTNSALSRYFKDYLPTHWTWKFCVESCHTNPTHTYFPRAQPSIQCSVNRLAMNILSVGECIYFPL